MSYSASPTDGQPQDVPPPPYLQLSRLTQRVGKAALAVLVLFGAVCAVVVAGLSLKWPLIHDAAIMQYVGWLIHQGAVPYRDIFDMNFPGTHLVHWLVLCIPGDMDLVWRCFDLGVLLTTLVLLAKLLPPRHYWAASATCVAFALYYLSLGPFYANGERDMLMTPLMIGGVIANVAMLEKARPRTWLAFLAGALFGAACTIKPTGIVMAVLEMGFSGLWLLRHGQSWRRVTGILAAAVLGVSLPIAGTMVWLYLVGGLGAFLDIELHYVPIYVTCMTQRADWTGWWTYYPLNILLVAVFLTPAYYFVTRRVTARFAAVVVAVLAGVGHFVLQQKGFGFVYHWTPMMAFMMPVAFWTLDEAVSGRTVWKWCLSVGLVVAVILAGCDEDCLHARMGNPVMERRHKQALGLAEYLKANLRPGEQVQVCEMICGGIDALLRAGVRLPTRINGDCCLFWHDPAIPYVAALRKQFLGDLVRNKPRFVVIFSMNCYLANGYKRLNKFPELKDWLNANYVRRVDHKEYWILERNDS